MAKLLPTIQFIKTEKHKGNGIESDPSRIVEQYFTTDGILVLEYDHHLDEISMTMNMFKALQSLSNQ